MAVVADGEFFIEDQVEELEVAQGLVVGAGGELLQRFGQERQAEFVGAGVDAVGDQLSHGTRP
jgi:hypothetical protein